MNHDELLAAYLDGFCDDAAEAVFDTHLLECEACWNAVTEDRRGRQLAQSLCEPMPHDLADRIAVATQPRQRRRPGPLLAAVAAGIVCGLLFLGSSMTRESRSVGSVMAELADQAVISERDVEGVVVTIASGTAPFAMPSDARLIDRSTPVVWLIERDGVNVLCVNGVRPALIGADVSPDRLLEIADQIELI